MIDFNDIEELIYAYHNRISATGSNFHRYLFSQIAWEERLIGIKGPKGVGKTTLLLQHIKESFPHRDDALFVSMDNLWFANHSLSDLVRYYYQHGGRYLFLDEIHHYKPWQMALKNFHDDYPELHIVYSGSSLLQLEKGEADLSRRVADYMLTGMSFREYLEYEGIVTLPVYTLDDILNRHIDIAWSIKDKVENILPHYEQYLQYGYYPFYKETKRTFSQRLQKVVNHILDVDFPAVEEVEVDTIRKTKKMLMVLAEHVPQTPNMNALYAQLETNRSQGLKMMHALDRAGLLALLTDNTKNLKTLSRPEKVFLNNPNLMYALGHKTEIGTIRETFFLNQVRQVSQTTYPSKGDFLINGQYLFEIGGPAKTFEQIKDVPNSFLGIDGLEIGSRNRIPLWMFGLLY